MLRSIDYLNYQFMIQCIDQIQVSLNQRFDHLAMLTDAQNVQTVVKDQEKRRALVRNFRMIKNCEKNRILNEQKYLKSIQRINRKLTKAEIIACENMFANCMNQYLNSQYEVRKSGQPQDLIDLFIFYYRQIKADTKVNQLKVIKNCQLFYDLNFMFDNLSYFLAHVQASMNHVYEEQKSKFFSLIKNQSKSLSPQKKGDEQQEQKFDTTGKSITKSKRKLQLYCFELSKLLCLESIYVNYFYFSTLDVDKRKTTLTANFLKRNVHIKRLIDDYYWEYHNHQDKTRKTKEKEASQKTY